MTILVDMDDVLEMLVAGWVRYNNRRFGTYATPDDVRDWDMSLAFPGHTHDEVYAAEMDDELWDEVGPMPGAVEYVKKMMDDGHEVFVVTSSRYETLKAKMEKVLFKYFPYLSWDHVIITNHKYLIKGDVLIDDGPHNLQRGDYQKILFSARHNEKFDESSVGAVRVHGWEEAYQAVKKLAEANQK